MAVTRPFAELGYCAVVRWEDQTGPDIDTVTGLIQEIAQTAVLPRFRQLLHGEVEKKVTPGDPDDIVTVVDHLVEEQLGHALVALAPSVPVIGEEAVHSRPELLQLLGSDGPFWVLDPIDGTKNFVRGDDRFGIMLAWVVAGGARAAWVVLPARGQTFVAEAGSGAFLNGARITTQPERRDNLSRATLHVRYMPGPLRETVLRAADGRFHHVPDSGCAAVEYTNILTGDSEFAAYYRLMPWDHAPPALLLIEGGGCVEHLDGTPYSVRSPNQLTIAARDATLSERVRAWMRPNGRGA
jgi:fructose-1,6-bisphosphatase/inositol monophosphatase family enzyme